MGPQVRVAQLWHVRQTPFAFVAAASIASNIRVAPWCRVTLNEEPFDLKSATARPGTVWEAAVQLWSHYQEGPGFLLCTACRWDFRLAPGDLRPY